ncbi:putative Integrase catalytic subunit [Cupriavidus necator]|uniref:Putative Integrase catalytic subunit n=1 Tax=Cupriavidus necator TaxID=106590 RepID=A0A1K0JP32_CUPNE|nr:putative Integrase catalytic subunit [Cupriavidus necator]
MLDTDALALLLSNGAIPEAGRRLLANVRARDASKLARSITGCIEYVNSQKMGWTVAVPGRTVGAPLAELLELDASVLEYYFQPWELELHVQTVDRPKGATRLIHRPQLALIRRDGIVVQDWKEEGLLFRRSEDAKSYAKDDSPPYHWHWRPGETAYEALGFRYELHSLAEIPLVLVANMRDLSRYAGMAPMPGERKAQLRAVIEREVVLTLRQLREGYQFDADTIRLAIAQRVLWCNLVHCRLDSDETFRVFRDPVAMAVCGSADPVRDSLPLPRQGNVIPGAMIQFNGESHWIECIHGESVRLRGAGDTEHVLPLAVVAHAALPRSIVAADGSVHPAIREQLALLPPTVLDEGIAKLNAVREGRSIRSKRQIARYQAIVVASGTDTEAAIRLAGNVRLRGNRSPRLTEAVEILAKKMIVRLYHRSPNVTAHGCYLRYKGVALRLHQEPISYPSFLCRVREYRNLTQKHGARAALVMTPIDGRLDPGLSPHGLLPHQCVHIDHTPADVETIAPAHGLPLGRPLVTLAHDACTKRSRALYLSYGPASAECVLMVLRDYVRRWGRLPQTIIVDGGLNLRGAAVMRFAQLHGITIRKRAKHNPRQGAPIETRNRSREWEVDRLLEGSTSHMKEARAYNGYPSPKDVAEETLLSVYRRYDAYFFNLKDAKHEHPELGMTPKAYEEALERERGTQPFRPVAFDEHLLMLTSPFASRAKHVIQPLRGVWVDYRWYWHDAFADAKKHDSGLVRVEPFNADVVYVEYHGQMLVAIARDVSSVPNRMHFQVEQAIRQMRKESGAKAQRSRHEYHEEGDGMSLDARHFDPCIAFQQQEMLRLYSTLAMVARVDWPSHTVQRPEACDVEMSNILPDAQRAPDAQEAAGHDAVAAHDASAAPTAPASTASTGPTAPKPKPKPIGAWPAQAEEHLALRSVDLKLIKGMA